MKPRFAFSTLLTGALLLATFGVPPHVARAAGVKVCKIEIGGNDMMQFDKSTITVAKDCTDVELTLTHTGKLPMQVMGHNWTLVKTSDLAAVATDGLSAGLQNDYVKAGDPRVIAHTKVIGGGENATVKFSLSQLKASESYSYLCTFPGHSALMKGTFAIG
jgi:azurin